MTARSLSLALIFAFILTCSSDFLAPCLAQENPNASATGTDIVAADCPPFTAFPQLGMTVVVSCQKTDSVAVTMPLKPDALGHPREKTIRGMYEFREYRITQADQQDYAFQNLMQLIPMAGFIAKYSDNSSTITARSGDTWMLINLRGDSYNISVVRDSQPGCAQVNNAEEISREMASQGRVAIYGIQFAPQDQVIQEKNLGILIELLNYIKQNPTTSLVIESHKISPKGTEDDDFEITRERANAVVDWLVAHGIPASRLQAKPFGRMQPLTENDTPVEIQCNDRIQITKALAVN